MSRKRARMAIKLSEEENNKESSNEESSNKESESKGEEDEKTESEVLDEETHASSSKTLHTQHGHPRLSTDSINKQRICTMRDFHVECSGFEYVTALLFNHHSA
ncbi:13048_t:CDS:2 [Racocetra persica]|uniref:13048_t:CDS:1 n=1 Tax=Racocetra persica TaxID=160502 RepID=A0ACA9KP90_9GLOM|nr:13048_t:CDS:2 [Racocetra persica]